MLLIEAWKLMAYSLYLIGADFFTSFPKVQLFDAIRKKCKLVANFPYMGKNHGKLAVDLRGFVVEDYVVFYNT
jgi:plasmid stabilization system protein ParE